MTATPRPSGAVLVSSRLTAIRAVVEETLGSETASRQAALERIEQIANASRTVSGIEAGGSASLLPADVATVLDALADAADLLSQRALSPCDGCTASPSDLCEPHAADLTRADAYRQLAAKLGGEAR